LLFKSEGISVCFVEGKEEKISDIAGSSDGAIIGFKEGVLGTLDGLRLGS